MYVLYQAYYKASTVLIIYGYTFIWICCSNKSDDICHSYSHFHAVCVTGLGVLNRFLNSTDPHNDILRWHQQLRLIIQCSCLHSELTVAVTGQHHMTRGLWSTHISPKGGIRWPRVLTNAWIFHAFSWMNSKNRKEHIQHTCYPSKDTYIIHKYTQRLDHHDFSQLKRNPIGLELLSGVCSPLTRTLTTVWSCASEPGVSFHMDKSGCNGENLSHVARRAKKGWGPCPGQKPSASIDQKPDSNMCPPSFTETMYTAPRVQNKAQIGFWTFYLT